MKENKVFEIVFILDKSGSMKGMESDVVGGFNSMLEKQKALDGKVYVTTIFFSNRSEVIHDRSLLQSVEPLSEKDYRVGGSTALLDAIGGAIKHISYIHKYSREEDVPSQTLFVITTDGMENSSKEYSSEEVKRLIKEKEECGWEFLFLADNIDAVETADRIGIRKEYAVNYHVKEDTGAVFEEINDVVKLCRKCPNPSRDWAKDFKERIERRGKKNGV